MEDSFEIKKHQIFILLQLTINQVPGKADPTCPENFVKTTPISCDKLGPNNIVLSDTMDMFRQKFHQCFNCKKVHNEN